VSSNDVEYCDTIKQLKTCKHLKAPSFDEDVDEDDDDEETTEEAKEGFSGGEIDTELVEFPQPRWSKRMAASE